MTHVENPLPTGKSALSSLTLKGAIAMALAYAAGRVGLHLPDGVLASVADVIIDLVFSLGLIAVGVGRARAGVPLR